jgi:microsomal epoxide hydrolase
MRAGSFGLPPGKVEVPTGCAIFPKEMIRPPRSWAEAQFDVRRWSVMPSGGHFAALEEPEALVAEIRGFFRELR